MTCLLLLLLRATPRLSSKRLSEEFAMNDLIVFGEDFGGLPSSTQHLISHLAQDRKIVWINSIGLRQPKLNWKDIKRAANKLLGLSKQGYGSQLAPNTDQQHVVARQDTKNRGSIQVINLRTIPAPKSRLARYVAKIMMCAQLKPILNKANLNQPILWSSLPTAADLCGELNEVAVIYYCGDDFSALAGVDHQTVAKHEEVLVSKAQLILVASPSMQARFPAHKTTLIPHGVDVDHFQTSVAKAEDFPSQGRPVAGFYGSLSSWFDSQLIQTVSDALPEWDFMLIGPLEIDKTLLPQGNNIYYMGPRPHHALPSYCQHWDVSLLPFKQNGQIAACSPLKLMEYLANQRPIITTDYPAVAPYQKYVTIIRSAQEMISTLRQATPLTTIPSDVVSQDTWQARSNTVARLMELL
jgi:glycosyltransferase involved in cell wall biosynthesis